MLFVLMGIILFIVFIVFIVLLGIWNDDCYSGNDYIKIKYKNFIKYYYLNPKEWNLERLKYKCTNISFSFIDYYKFYFFRHSIDKQIKNQKQNELKKIFIQNIQNDIDRVSNDASKKIRYAENIMKNIKLR